MITALSITTIAHAEHTEFDTKYPMPHLRLHDGRFVDQRPSDVQMEVALPSIM